MHNMKRMIKTEKAYIKCFSEENERENIVLYKDALIPEMHSHNFTYIKSYEDEVALDLIITNEIIRSIQEGEIYLKIVIEGPPLSEKLLEKHGPKWLCTLGYYEFQVDELSNLKLVDGCQLIKLDASCIEDALKLDLKVNEEDGDNEFVLKRHNRRTKVYLDEGDVESFLSYVRGEVVGHCDLFIHNKTAKIEDFDVAPLWQRKGIGTSMMKLIVTEAISRGAELIYLITDEEDTAKDMYKKCGMVHMGNKYEYLFVLNPIKNRPQ